MAVRAGSRLPFSLSRSCYRADCAIFLLFNVSTASCFIPLPPFYDIARRAFVYTLHKCALSSVVHGLRGTCLSMWRRYAQTPDRPPSPLPTLISPSSSFPAPPPTSPFSSAENTPFTPALLPLLSYMHSESLADARTYRK
ncbi:hypothetical protein B0H13DRAFT_59262 [Mycena leptocephala]|nr:hypothetical protein B0H13DRAFT_59262 [Mycena leptocephala]